MNKYKYWTYYSFGDWRLKQEIKDFWILLESEMLADFEKWSNLTLEEEDDAYQEFILDYSELESPDYFDFLFFFEDYFSIAPKPLHTVTWHLPENFSLDDNLIFDFLFFCFFIYFFLDSHICLVIFMIFYFLHEASYLPEAADIEEDEDIEDFFDDEFYDSLVLFTPFWEDDFTFENFSNFYFSHYYGANSFKFFNKFNKKFIKLKKQ